MRIHKMIHTGCLVVDIQTIKTCLLKLVLLGLIAFAASSNLIFVWSVVERLKCSHPHSDPII